MKDTMFYGLIFGCPKQDESIDCPLKEIRKIPSIDKRIDWVDSLSDDELLRLRNQHRECSCKK